MHQPKYTEVKNDGMRIFLIGHWGGRNVGDELILYSQLHMLKQKFRKAEFIVYTYDEKKTENLYNSSGFKINTCKGYTVRKLLGSIKQIVYWCRRADFVILGGGGLIQDKYFVYNIYSFLLPVLISYVLNKPVYTLSLGVYQIRSKINRVLLRLLLEYSRLNSVRDEVSYNKCSKYLNRSITKPTSIKLTPDSAIYLYKIYEKQYNKTEYKSCAIMLREVFAPYIDTVVNLAIKVVNKYNIRRIYLVTYEDAKVERQLLNSLKSALLIKKRDLNIRLIDFPEPLIFLHIIDSVDIVISGRLHGCITALALSKKLLSISYEEKMSNFCKMWNIPYFDKEELFKLDADSILNLVADTNRQKRKIEQNIKILDSFINDIVSSLNEKAKPISCADKIKLVFYIVTSGFYLTSMHLIKRIWNIIQF